MEDTSAVELDQFVYGLWNKGASPSEGVRQPELWGCVFLSLLQSVVVGFEQELFKL